MWNKNDFWICPAIFVLDRAAAAVNHVASVRHGVTEITLSDGRLVRATLHVKDVKISAQKPGGVDISYNVVAEVMAIPSVPILDVHETISVKVRRQIRRAKCHSIREVCFATYPGYGVPRKHWKVGAGGFEGDQYRAEERGLAAAESLYAEVSKGVAGVKLAKRRASECADRK